VQQLHLKNTTSEHLAYKIKTTAPRLYCVRPNSSIIEPGASVEVAIIRQAKDNSNPEDRKKDKFLVLSTPIHSVPEDVNYAELWTDLEQHAKSAISSKKIRVQSNSDSLTSEVPPPAPEAAPPAVPSGASSRHVSGANVPVPGGAPVESSTATSPVAPAPQPADPLLFETPLKSLNGDAHLSGGDEVQQASERARAKISNLSKELKSDRLSSSSPSPTPAVARQKSGVDIQNGVPVHFVLLLALIAFLIGWKLF
jgi:vesicle-associated membrane protein-associated protein A